MQRSIASAILLLLIAIVAVASVSASTGEYYVVVGESSPATDVITGANFAASMKGSVAVTFQSAIDKDLYPELSASTMKYQVFVVIDGEEITIVGGNKGDAWDAAKLYFERKGFEVEEISSGYTPEDVLLAPLPEKIAAPPSAQEPKDDAVVAAPIAPAQDDTRTQEGVALEDDAPKEMVVADAPVDPLQQEKRGVFRRIWGWFAGLFS